MARREILHAVNEAAKEASEAGRILQAHQQAEELSRAAKKIEGAQEKPPGSERHVEPTPEKNPRKKLMDELAERDMERRGVKEEDETPEPAKVAAPAAPVEAAAPVPEVVPPVASEPIKTVRVKVDGQEFDAPLAEVEEAGGVSAYQRIKAADNRLQKANETLAQTRQTQAAIAEWIQKNQTQKEPPVTDAAFIASKIDTVRFGTPEESAAAMQEILARSTPKYEPDQLVARAVSAINQDQAERRFVDEFSDVVKVPLLLKLTIQLKNERLAQLKAPPPDWGEWYRTIGNEVRGAIGRQSQPASASPESAAPSGTTSAPDKEARKASIVNLPTAAARAALPEADKPESRDDLLNWARKTRGQPIG